MMLSIARGAVAPALTLTLLLSVAAAGGADRTPAAKLVPGDAAFYATIPNVEAMLADGKRTNVLKLIDDPSMRAVVEQAKGAITEHVNKSFREQLGRIGLLDPPKLTDLPTPTGRVIIAGRFGPPDSTYYAGDDSGVPAEDAREMHVAVVVEFGERIDEFRRQFDRVAEAMLDKGARRQRRSVRGGELQIFESDTWAGQGFCIAIVGDTVVASCTPPLATDMLALLDGADRPTVADHERHDAMLRRVDGPGHVFGFVDVGTFIAEGKRAHAGADAMTFTRSIKALGLDNVVGAAAALELLPREDVQASLRSFVCIDGRPRGVPALIAGRNVPTTPPPSATSGLTALTVLNYDLGDVYDQALQIATLATGKPVGMVGQMAMAATAANDPSGRPPVDLRREVLGQIAPPLVLRIRHTPPYTDPTGQFSMVSAAVRDSAVLNEALARIHDTFIANGDREMRRELLQQTLYLIPHAGAPFMAMAGATPTPMTAGAISVTGSNLLVGTEPGVAQAIRDERNDATDPIEADDMFRHARRALPAEAVLWQYGNRRREMAAMWDAFGKAAREVAEADAAGSFGPEPVGPDHPIAHRRRNAMSPQAAIVEQLKGKVDLTLLPEFEKVERYFGATVLSVRTVDDGLMLESLDLSPPPGR